MNKKMNKVKLRRKIRVRKKIFGTSERPRLNVYRSLKHIYAQLIDDTAGKTLVSASSKAAEVEEKIKAAGSKVEASKIVGELLAQRAKEAKIETAVFDRNGFRFHGRVKAVADGAKEGGLKI